MTYELLFYSFQHQDMAGSRRSTNQNRRDIRRRREQRGNVNDVSKIIRNEFLRINFIKCLHFNSFMSFCLIYSQGNSSDEENVPPIPHNGILQGLRQQSDIQRQLDALERDQDALQRFHAEEIAQLRAGCENFVEEFQGLLEPETDYETDALMFSETESEASSSESSFLSDSSNLSSDEDSKEDTENQDNKKKNIRKVSIITTFIILRKVL